MADPNDVGTTQLYNYPDLPNPAGEAIRRLVDAVKSPDDAEGWPRIIVPALVTGIGIEVVRRVML